MTPGANETVVAYSRWVWAMIWVGFAVLGAGVGWLIVMLAEWVADLPWAPFQGPFELVSTVTDNSLATVVALAAGAIGGLVVAYLSVRESLTVSISNDQVTLTRDGTAQVVRRSEVTAAFLDDKQLVLLGHAHEELAREPTEHDHANGYRKAFEAHGFRWHPDGDPHRDEYRRWVEGTPDLPAAANAVFKAREKALANKDRDDAADLRTELAKLGIVVRDEEKRQYWRRTRND